jgi:hypothetical protein
MVHKTRKKPYHQVTYYNHVTYITNDNRTVASWKKKPKENNASLIPRRSVERKKNSTSTKTSPADCQASAVRVGHDALNLYSTIDGHGERVLDETHRMMPDQAQISTPTRELAGYC